ncbi:MAG: PAS domain S-box protein, partial [Alphaproteobacteria bacterium]|nr:PAS domain S-box protein [Alphaproteobacteria bacterium]
MQAGFGPEFLDRFHEVPASGASSCARAMRAKSRVVVSDTETDVDYEPLRAIARRSGYRSVQSTPLVSRDGSLIGILSTHFAHPHSLTSSEEKRLDLYARQTSDFIERCRIDEELRRSEADRKRLDEVRAHLAAIVESSNDAIISKGLDTIILSWNQGAERLFGYTAEEAIGRPITLLIPEERLDEEPKILERIRAGERVDHFETVRQRKDGRLVDISLTISPVRNAAGEIIAASKIARDVSER